MFLVHVVLQEEVTRVVGFYNAVDFTLSLRNTEKSMLLRNAS
jgi:hypothetical protein